MEASIFNHGNDITPEAALKLCSDHMKGEWERISVDDFELSVIR